MMKLRKYVSEDCAFLAALFYDTVHTVNAADYTKAQLDVWTTGQVDLQAWNVSFLNHHTIVAEADGVITGFGDMDDTGYLDRLYVHKAYQRRGVASAICDALETAYAAKTLETAGKKGEAVPVCFTTHASITARPFFEARGYSVICSQQVERQGILLTNYVMEKRSSDGR